MLKRHILLIVCFFYILNLISLNFTFEKITDISYDRITSYVTDKDYSWNYNHVGDNIISVIKDNYNYKFIIKYEFNYFGIIKNKYVVVNRNLKKLKEFTVSDEVKLYDYKNRFVFLDKNRLIKQIDAIDNKWLKNENIIYKEFITNIKNSGSRKDRISDIFDKSYFFFNKDSFFCLEKEGSRILQYDLKKKTLRNEQLNLLFNGLFNPVINDKFLVCNHFADMYLSWYFFYDIKTLSLIDDMSDRTLLSKIPFELGDYRDWETSELFCSNGDFYLWIYCNQKLTIFKVIIK